MKYQSIIASLLFIFSFNSCQYLQKIKDRFQKNNKIVGQGADEIENIDIDSSAKGSDFGIDGLSSVYFNLDSSQLSPEVKNTLKQNKQWLDNNPQVKKLELEGHCDYLGSEAYNIGLGERRARVVLNYMISIGVLASKLSTISYGEERPLSQTSTRLNRRVNFVPIY